MKKNRGDLFDHLDKFTPLYPPEGEYYADPFIFKQSGINYIFFEKYDYQKGVIACVSVDNKLRFSKPVTVLELDKHLSFPYIFEDQGTIYMIPESSQMREIALWEATEFPHQWKKRKVLLKGRDFADTILFKHNGLYWLFTSVNFSKLNIYFAESLSAEFQPHPINKQHILGDFIRHIAPQGRNAGGVFLHEGRVIRPVMDSRKTYGEAMMLNEILELTTTTFKERTIHRIEPTWAPELIRTHTFNVNDDLVVYDGCYKILY